MTGPKSLELVEAVLNHETPSRTPVAPIMGLATAKYSGMDVSELLHDGKKQAKSQLAALNHFGYDGVFTVMDLTLEAESLGALVGSKPSAPPYIRRHAVKDAHGVLELQPVESAGRIRAFIEAAEGLVRAVGRTNLVSTYIAGPFTLAGQLMGLDRLLDLCIEGDELAVKAVAHAETLVHELIEEYSRVGVHNIVVLEPSASASVISPAYFRTYSLPYVKNLVKRSHDAGSRSTLHICGNSRPLIGMMIESQADVLSIDSAVQVSDALTKAAGRCAVLGNVNTTMMLSGSAIDVSKAAAECMIAVPDQGALILATGCDVPIETPEENIKALVSSVVG